jgi:hypothetical protein
MDTNPYESPQSKVEDDFTVSGDLMGWFAHVGNRAEQKRARNGDASLSKPEKLIYELWLLDTEIQEGGLSKYFANRGLRQWRHCVALVPQAIPSFLRFAQRVDGLLRIDPNPNGAGLIASVASAAEADNLYRQYRRPIVAELRDVIKPPTEATAVDELRWALSIPVRYLLLFLLGSLPVLIVVVLVLRYAKWTP